MFSRVHAARPADRRVGRADPRARASTRCSTACRARPTTGCCGCSVGSGRAARRGDPAIALRMGAALGVESLLTNGPIKAMFRRVRPERRPPARGTAALRHAPPDHQLVPVGPRRVGVHRGHAARRRPGHPGAGSRWRRSVAASRVYTRCTTPPTSSPAPRSASRWARSPAGSSRSQLTRRRFADARGSGMVVEDATIPADACRNPSRRSPVARSIAVTFDYRCPFAYNGNAAVIAALRAGSDVDFRFTPFSLDQAHVEEGEPPVWDREPDGVGHRHARAAVRHRGPRRVPRPVLRRPPRAVRGPPRPGPEARPRRRRCATPSPRPGSTPTRSPRRSRAAVR